MSLRTARLSKNICYVLACAAAVVGLFFERNSLRVVSLVIAVVFLVLGIVITALAYRCPHCKRMLPKGIIPEKCPHCGEELL